MAKRSPLTYVEPVKYPLSGSRGIVSIPTRIVRTVTSIIFMPISDEIIRYDINKSGRKISPSKKVK